MHLSMIYLIFVFLIEQSSCQTIQYFSSCNCALLPSACTANCCCDPSCSTSDLNAFGCSTNVNTNQNKQWCVPSNSMFLNNTPYIVHVMGNLICVDINNSQMMNYYQTPDVNAAKSAQDLLQQLLAQEESTFTKQPLINTLDLNSNKNIFDSSDLIWLLFSTNTLGYLSLPNQVGKECTAGAPLNLYVSKSGACLQTPTSIRAQCSATTTVTPLSISYFLGNFAIIQKPSSLNTCFKSIQNPASPFDYYTNCMIPASKYLIQISVYKCTFEDGTAISNCQTLVPSTNGGTTCSNLVKSLTYILRYDSSTGGVIEAAIEAVFFNYANYATNTDKHVQTFRIVYIPSSVKMSDYDTVSGKMLSGNPGYLVGKPIQAGVAQTSSVNLVYLTYQKANSQGVCPSDDNSRSNVNFGINLLSECFLSYANLNPASNPTFCSDLQTLIYNTILGFAVDQRPNLFAPFANSKSTDFKSILNSIPNTQPTSNNNGVGGICSSIINGVDIIIGFAYVGNLDNPQAQLVYISYSYSSSIAVNSRCYNQICSNLNQKIKLSTRVTFVDVSQPPLLTQSVIPRPQVTLPGDFFFPLSSFSSPASKPHPLILYVFCFTLILLF